jgi:hypothetical protein
MVKNGMEKEEVESQLSELFNRYDRDGKPVQKYVIVF